MIKAEYITHMGNDDLVVNAARVSFDKRSEQYSAEANARLIKYLASHGHWTPFAHCQITVRETVPIFVARQRFKHMVGFNYSEVSRRYVDDEPEFFTPDAWRSRPDGSVKQGSGDEHKNSWAWQHDYQSYTLTAYDMYQQMIADGIAPEQARMVLPQSMMTSYYVTGSLAAWARAYKQRIDPHAQKEIQDLAHQWGGIIAPLFSESWQALAV